MIQQLLLIFSIVVLGLSKPMFETDITTETKTVLLEEKITYGSARTIGVQTLEYSCLYTDEEIYLIALVALAEAEGECELGQRLVIDTILNRVDSPHFPNTVEEVIYQPNQFSSMWDGRHTRVTITNDIYDLVREEIRSRENTDVMFFTAGKYGKYGSPMFQIENHYFSSYE